MNDLEQRISYLEGVIASMVKSDRVVLDKTLQLQNGRNIQVAYGAGTKIGTVGGASGQKLGFFGATPVVQQPLGAAPTAAQISTVLLTLGLTHN